MSKHFDIRKDVSDLVRRQVEGQDRTPLIRYLLEKKVGKRARKALRKRAMAELFPLRKKARKYTRLIRRSRQRLADIKADVDNLKRMRRGYPPGRPPRGPPGPPPPRAKLRKLNRQIREREQAFRDTARRMQRDEQDLRDVVRRFPRPPEPRTAPWPQYPRFGYPPGPPRPPGAPGGPHFPEHFRPPIPHHLRRQYRPQPYARQQRYAYPVHPVGPPEVYRYARPGEPPEVTPVVRLTAPTVEEEIERRYREGLAQMEQRGMAEEYAREMAPVMERMRRPPPERLFYPPERREIGRQPIPGLSRRVFHIPEQPVMQQLGQEYAGEVIPAERRFRVMEREGIDPRPAEREFEEGLIERLEEQEGIDPLEARAVAEELAVEDIPPGAVSPPVELGDPEAVAIARQAMEQREELLREQERGRELTGELEHQMARLRGTREPVPPGEMARLTEQTRRLTRELGETTMGEPRPLRIPEPIRRTLETEERRLSDILESGELGLRGAVEGIEAVEHPEEAELVEDIQRLFEQVETRHPRIQPGIIPEEAWEFGPQEEVVAPAEPGLFGTQEPEMAREAEAEEARLERLARVRREIERRRQLRYLAKKDPQPLPEFPPWAKRPVEREFEEEEEEEEEGEEEEEEEEGEEEEGEVMPIPIPVEMTWDPAHQLRWARASRTQRRNWAEAYRSAREQRRILGLPQPQPPAGQGLYVPNLYSWVQNMKQIYPHLSQKQIITMSKEVRPLRDINIEGGRKLKKKAKKKANMKAGAKKNPWIQHVKKYLPGIKRKHPNKSHKEHMRLVRKNYTPVKKTKKTKGGRKKFKTHKCLARGLIVGGMTQWGPYEGKATQLIGMEAGKKNKNKFKAKAGELIMGSKPIRLGGKKKRKPNKWAKHVAKTMPKIKKKYPNKSMKEIMALVKKTYKK